MKLVLGVIGLGLAAVLGVCGPGHAAGSGGEGEGRRAGPGGAGTAATPVAADSSKDHPPAFFLSWSAPYGMPGARDTIITSCDDSTASDTLYLTFDPGRDQKRLLAVDAMLFIRAAPGDTLESFWDLARPGPPPRKLRVDFDDPPPGCPSPWPATGMGIPRYRKERDIGRLLLTYSVSSSEAGPLVGGTRYFFARVILGHRGRAAGCSRPVCVELVRLKPGYGPWSDWIMAGERFVSWNSRGGTACAEYRLRPPEMDPLLRPAAPDTTRK